MFNITDALKEEYSPSSLTLFIPKNGGRLLILRNGRGLLSLKPTLFVRFNSGAKIQLFVI